MTTLAVAEVDRVVLGTEFQEPKMNSEVMNSDRRISWKQTACPIFRLQEVAVQMVKALPLQIP